MRIYQSILLSFLAASTSSIAAETESWKKYLCDLQKATRYVDGGVLEEEERGLLGGFEEDKYPESTELYVRYENKQLRFYGSIFHDMHFSKKDIQDSNRIFKTKPSLLGKVVDEGKKLAGKIPNLIDDETDGNAKTIVDENHRQQVGRIYIWKVHPKPETDEGGPISNIVGTSRKAAIEFVSNDGGQLSRSFIPDAIQLVYQRHEPKQGEVLSETVKYEFECQ